METIRRNIDAVILAMVRRAAITAYTPKQLRDAYFDSFGRHLPEEIQTPLDREVWEWLFSFRNDARSYLPGKRHKSSSVRHDITLNHVQAIRNTLRFLDVCNDAPEVADDHASWVAFLDHVLQMLARLPPVFPRDLPRPLHFFGREDAVEELHRFLMREEAPVAVALHGLRGVGKTTLAAAYAHQQQEHYQVVAWIRAHDETARHRDYIELGLKLGWISKRMERGAVAIAQIREELAKGPDRKLLILDDAPSAEAVRDLLPAEGACRVLITSNSHAWNAVATPMPLLVLSPRSGGEYLVTRTKRPEQRDVAEHLSEMLDGLPLALAQAAAYCERRKTPFPRYLEAYEQATLSYLRDDKDVAGDYHRERQDRSKRTVAGTFQLAIEALNRPLAKPMLEHASLLAVTPIPVAFFEEGRKHLGEPFASCTDKEIDDAIGELLSFALIDRIAHRDERKGARATDAITLHTLVREIAADKIAIKERNAALERSVEVIGELYPKNAYSDPRQWADSFALTPHLLFLWRRGIPANAHPLAWAGLLNHVAGYLHGRASYAEAERVMTDLTGLLAKRADPNDPEMAIALDHLGMMLLEQGRLKEARPHLERSLTIRRERTPDDPLLAIGLDHFGMLLLREGDAPSARVMLEQALAIKEKKLGDHHPAVAATLHNLASIPGPNARQAADMMARVIDILNANDIEDLKLAHAHNMLGKILLDQRATDRARPNLEIAYTLYEALAGEDHPDTAMAIHNLALLNLAEGHAEEAEALALRALAITGKAVPPSDPRLGYIIIGLAEARFKRGNPNFRSDLLIASGILRAAGDPAASAVRRRAWWLTTRWLIYFGVKFIYVVIKLALLAAVVIGFPIWLIWQLVTWLWGT